jgi:hypothetical protein
MKKAGRSEYETVIENEVYYSDLTDEEKLVWDNLKSLIVTEYGSKVWDKIHICDKFKDESLWKTFGCHFKQYDVIFILRSLIKRVALLAGREVSEEKTEHIISAVKKDKIPKDFKKTL